MLQWSGWQSIKALKNLITLTVFNYDKNHDQRKDKESNELQGKTESWVSLHFQTERQSFLFYSHKYSSIIFPVRLHSENFTRWNMNASKVGYLWKWATFLPSIMWYTVISNHIYLDSKKFFFDPEQSGLCVCECLELDDTWNNTIFQSYLFQ